MDFEGDGKDVVKGMVVKHPIARLFHQRHNWSIVEKYVK